MIKKILLSLTILLSFANAYQSDLIRPKKGQGTIIDIGINDPTKHNTIIAKEWVLVDALFREIDKENAEFARELSEQYDCLTDDLNNVNCPEKAETCPKSFLYDKGESTKYTKSFPVNDVVTGTDAKGITTYACPSDAKVTSSYTGTCKTITEEVSGTKTYNYSDSNSIAVSNGFDTVLNLAGGSYIYKNKLCTIINDACSFYDIISQNVKPQKEIQGLTNPIIIYWKYATSYKLYVYNGYPKPFFSKKKKSGTDEKKVTVNGSTISRRGSDPEPLNYDYKTTEKNTYCETRYTCEKTYNYYLYDCDNLVDDAVSSWFGPVIDTGADCGGTCNGYNCDCNPVDAPWNNCQKPQWLCPFDKSKACTKIIDGNTDNLDTGDDQYIYKNGSSEKYDVRLEADRSCVEGMTWNADEQRCEDGALKKCLKENYTLDRALNECYGPASCEKDELYEPLLRKCISRIEDVKKCKEGFSFDNNKNRCVLDPKCEKGVIDASGKCIGKIDPCYSGVYDTNGFCLHLVEETDIFGNIQLLANTGNFSGLDIPVYSYLNSSLDAVTLTPDQGEYSISDDSPTGYEMIFKTTASENYDLGVIYPTDTAVFGDKITFNFWIKWDGTVSGSGGMPIAFSGYDLWIRNTSEGTIGMGFNTGQGDIVGVMDMSPYANRWIEITAVFTHLDPEQNELYLDGKKIDLKYNYYDAQDRKYKTWDTREEAEAYERNSGHDIRITLDSRAKIDGPIHFNGWEISNNYGLNYKIAGLKVYNEGKTYAEIHMTSDGSNLMNLHSEEQLSSISSSYLKGKGYTDGGSSLVMEVFHYGSGCGGINFSPAPDRYEVIRNNGSNIKEGTTPNDSCVQDYLIESDDKKNSTIIAIWNNPPERIDYLCDDFCFISPPKDKIEKEAKIVSSELCPKNKDKIFWRYQNEECVADIVEEPFICDGDDFVYDRVNNVCSALMDGWHIAEGASPGIWYTSPDKRKMYQAKNGGVIIKISDKIYKDDITFKGNFIIMDGDSELFTTNGVDQWATAGALNRYKDDDFIGFVFGYDEENKNGYLLSINKSLIDPDKGGAGHSYLDKGNVSGITLRKGNPLKHPWGLGDNGTELVVIAENLGTKTELQNDSTIFDGWHREERIDIKVNYTKTSIKVWIRNRLVINYTIPNGEFKEGKIGFLNYSQGSVLYDGFEILTSDLCREGLKFSDELNKCYVPIATKYANVNGRTFIDDLSSVLYKTEAFCPKEGTLDNNKCFYNLSCDIGRFNSSSFFCEDSLNTNLCLAPKEIAISSKFKENSFDEVINIKASGQFSYHYPDLRNKKSGLSISSTLLKLSDNNWYKFEAIGENNDIGWRDAEISRSGINVKIIKASNYTVNSYANGECNDFLGNGDIRTSNECISDIDITLPEGLSLIGISDVQSVTNESVGNNYFNEIFTINDKYTYYRKGFGRLAQIDIMGSEPVCKQSPTCPENEVLEYQGSNPICISQEFMYYCNDQRELVPNTSICMNDGFCEEGFINFDGKCIRDYTYYKYFCPTGYEIAETGLDCEGSCGFDDCSCNTETPPANNCKKAFNPDGTVEQKEIRTIREHLVTGSLLEEEYGNYKNYSCGEDCKFNIVKIEGKANKLCFEKRNGDKQCLTVDGCSFKGSIEDLYSKEEFPKLKDLNLIDTHTLTLADYNLPSLVQPQDSITCPSTGMTYSQATRYCEGSANFYDWEKKGSSDGAWSVTDNGNKIYQGFNTSSPAFYVSKITYPQNVVFSGQMTVGNDGDDDWVGLVFGYKDTRNYYVARLSRDPNDPIRHTVTHSGNKLSLIKVTNGTAVTLTTADHPGWKVNRVLNIKVAYIDKKILVYIDGTKYIDYSSAIDLVGGRIGFYNFSQSTVTYKGFHISSSPNCQTGYSWDDTSRSCLKPAPLPDTSKNKIESTCKMNGHIGWHTRDEGIVSIVSDKDRIKFWDPYKDKDLGFLEFVKDTNEQDNKDGFRPENQYLYNLLSDKFTSIDKVGNSLEFVSSTVLSPQQCDYFAKKYDLFNYSSGVTSNKLKQMSGDRYRPMENNPKCNEGMYVSEINSCIGGVNNPQLCVNGKFTATTGINTLTSYGVTGVTNTIQALEIYQTGKYTLQIETSGSMNVYLDGNLIASIGTSEPYARMKIDLIKGYHKLKITNSGTMALALSDKSNTVFFNSRKWCNTNTDVTCPVSGFVNYHNTCERKTSSYCETGTFNETTKKCTIKPKCILVNNGKDRSTFADQDQSVKITYKLNGSIKRICSPLTCKDNFCQLATCVPPSIGRNVELTAAEKDQGLCLDQECDANLPYYEFCGIQGSCDTTREDVIVIGEYPNDKCYEKYCDSGTYDPASGKCKVLECPSNTVETPEGYCTRK